MAALAWGAVSASLVGTTCAASAVRRVEMSAVKKTYEASSESLILSKTFDAVHSRVNLRICAFGAKCKGAQSSSFSMPDLLPQTAGFDEGLKTIRRLQNLLHPAAKHSNHPPNMGTLECRLKAGSGLPGLTTRQNNSEGGHERERACLFQQEIS